MRKRLSSGTVFFLLLLLLSQPSSHAQTAASPQSMTVAQILERMASNISGLTSFVVPIHIDAHVKEGPLSVPVTMDGNRYFKAPDKAALELTGLPTVAKTFSNIYASLGTPLTWPKTYDIVLNNVAASGNQNVYELRGTYKRPSNVDHVLLDVNGVTFDPIQARWFYRNGATIVMNIQEGVAGGSYRLPLRETVDVNFPQYHGNADITYGNYSTNVPLADSIFSSK
jgi:hypothetical protein